MREALVKDQPPSADGGEHLPLQLFAFKWAVPGFSVKTGRIHRPFKIRIENSNIGGSADRQGSGGDVQNPGRPEGHELYEPGNGE